MSPNSHCCRIREVFQLDNIFHARLKPFQSEDRLLGEMAELKKQLAVEQAERADLDDLVTRVQNEKQRLAQRVNKLTINGAHVLTGSARSHRKRKL